jgi:hypothetical protein
MANYSGPRRATSTGTTITVNSNALPAWLPDPGSWSTVLGGARPASLNSAESIKGSFGSLFTSSRNWNGPNGLFDDFTGAVWNEHIGTYGAFLLMGGGHATNWGMADNCVPMWRADTRQWSLLTNPTYPGEIDNADWTLNIQLPYTSSLLNNYGELATGVPASNHSRCLPCILPPEHGGGASGSLLIPRLMAIHTDGNGAGQALGHKLNCATALTVGPAAASVAGGGWSRFGIDNLGGRAWSACVDTFRGDIYVAHQASSWLIEKFNSATTSVSNVTPSGYVDNNVAGMPLIYDDTHDIVIIFCKDFSLRVYLAPLTAGAAAISHTISGTQPSSGIPDGAGSVGSSGGVWCPDFPPNGAILHYNPANHQIKALTAPANPRVAGGVWTWVTLSASNTLSGRGDALYWYNRLQYSRKLKTCFLLSTSNDSYGGMAAFRPSEIT